MLVERLKRLFQNPTAVRPLVKSMRSTFSQYGEDHILAILLAPGSAGTYVDVGSHHPTDGSNTYKLYLKGWRGLTVDPNPEFRSAYARFRPQEPHLVEGVSDSPGSLTYYSFNHSVLNTFSDERAAQLADSGTPVKARSSVRTRPLRDMVEEQLGGRSIDLLSVDCEGFDLQVIRSLDLARHRPTVIIMEDFARLAMFRSGEGESDLHRHLADNGYRPIAQLAFSAIYVAEDHEALMSRSEAFSLSRIQGGILPSSRVPT